MNLVENTTRLQVILDRAVAGDDGAYDELFERAFERLRRLSRRMLNSYPHLRRWEATDDVLQNAALRLRASVKDVAPPNVRAFIGLAATQIRRTLIDLARKHFGPLGVGTHHHSDGVGDSGRERDVVADTAAEPETLAAWAEFHEAIGRLPEAEREVFEIVWYAGATRDEAAQLLGVSSRTVIRRLNQARLSLCGRLDAAPPL
jgi:RNA polymerase sigma-70 factor (ECF subfamily)